MFPFVSLQGKVRGPKEVQRRGRKEGVAKKGVAKMGVAKMGVESKKCNIWMKSCVNLDVSSIFFLFPYIFRFLSNRSVCPVSFGIESGVGASGE